MTEKGIAEARRVALKLAGFPIDTAYTSCLSRAIQSMEIVLAELNLRDIKVIKSEALNERHYGDLQGLNKEETAEKYGEKQTMLWRRSYTIAPPNGESLKNAAARVLPFFRTTILKDIQNGMNVLAIAHGNTLRTIVKELDHLSDEEIVGVSITTGEVIVYTFDRATEAILKEIL
ncbi:MAG: 2,3-diphosphoglycerate-dependent phosphoglycerate mutase [Bacteroidota bacterium]